MKVLKSYTFSTVTRATINHDDSWYGGDVIELNETDLGAYTENGPAGKIQSLKAYAKKHYGMGLLAEVNEKNNTLVIQAFALPPAPKEKAPKEKAPKEVK